MSRFQGLLGTALAYSTAHSFMDKDPAMREGWGWFSAVIVLLLAITYLIEHWKNARPKPQSATDDAK